MTSETAKLPTILGAFEDQVDKFRSAIKSNDFTKANDWTFHIFHTGLRFIENFADCINCKQNARRIDFPEIEYFLRKVNECQCLINEEHNKGRVDLKIDGLTAFEVMIKNLCPHSGMTPRATTFPIEPTFSPSTPSFNFDPFPLFPLLSLHKNGFDVCKSPMNCTFAVTPPVIGPSMTPRNCAVPNSIFKADVNIQMRDMTSFSLGTPTFQKSAFAQSDDDGINSNASIFTPKPLVLDLPSNIKNQKVKDKVIDSGLNSDIDSSKVEESKEDKPLTREIGEIFNLPSDSESEYDGKESDVTDGIDGNDDDDYDDYDVPYKERAGPAHRRHVSGSTSKPKKKQTVQNRSRLQSKPTIRKQNVAPKPMRFIGFSDMSLSKVSDVAVDPTLSLPPNEQSKMVQIINHTPPNVIETASNSSRLVVAVLKGDILNCYLKSGEFISIFLNKDQVEMLQCGPTPTLFRAAIGKMSSKVLPVKNLPCFMLPNGKTLALGRSCSNISDTDKDYRRLVRCMWQHVANLVNSDLTKCGAQCLTIDDSYKCSICLMSFDRPLNCQRHLLSHLGNTDDLICEFCDKSFLRIDAFQRHCDKRCHYLA